MSYIDTKIKSIKKVWKKFTAFGAWIGAIAASLLIPLPGWGDSVQHSSQIRFIIFIATVIAGFTLLLTYTIKNKLIWLVISVLVFILLMVAHKLYNQNIDKRTMKYVDSSVVIGDELKDSVHFEATLDLLHLDKDEILMTVGGDASIIWTEKSIGKNKNRLIFLLVMNYCLLAIFLVSFTNTVTLYTS
jgi:hypothetical protein